MNGTKSYIVQKQNDGVFPAAARRICSTFLSAHSLPFLFLFFIFRYRIVSAMAAKQQDVATHYECETMIRGSTREEADILKMYHAVEVSSNRMKVRMYNTTCMCSLLFSKNTTTWQSLCVNHEHKRKAVQSIPTAYI